MKPSTIKIVIADDHSVVRYGMMILVKDLYPFSEILHAGTFNETLDLLKLNKIDLIILDINLPGGNNTNMIETLNSLQNGIKVLMFSAYDENVYATRYLQSGAKGYLHKQTANEEIKKALNIVLSGGVYRSTEVKDLMLNQSFNFSEDLNPLSVLSNREIEVAKLLISGNGITDISTVMKLSMSTVSTYKNRIFEKLKVINVVQLIDKFKLWEENS